MKTKKSKAGKISINDLTDYEMARWWALYSGVNLIADKADEMKIDFENVNINRIALEKYVDELADDVLVQIENSHKYTAVQ